MGRKRPKVVFTVSSKSPGGDTHRLPRALDDIKRRLDARHGSGTAQWREADRMGTRGRRNDCRGSSPAFDPMRLTCRRAARSSSMRLRGTKSSHCAAIPSRRVGQALPPANIILRKPYRPSSCARAVVLLSSSLQLPHRACVRTAHKRRSLFSALLFLEISARHDDSPRGVPLRSVCPMGHGLAFSPPPFSFSLRFLRVFASLRGSFPPQPTPRSHHVQPAGCGLPR